MKRIMKLLNTTRSEIEVVVFICFVICSFTEAYLDMIK